VEKKKKV